MKSQGIGPLTASGDGRATVVGTGRAFLIGSVGTVVLHDEASGEVVLTDRGWRHVRYAYEYAVEHGYDGGI